MSNLRLREIVARHEAGHAVASIVMGWSIRYVTLRPQGGYAGSTLSRPPRRYHLLDAGAVYLAGLAAECTLLDDRRFMVRGTLCDLKDTRDAARRLVRMRARQGELPRVDASWSEWDIGARMWHLARDLVAQYRDAIDWVAAELTRSSTAVPGSWIRNAVANSPCSNEPPEPDDWWAPRYSRLQWQQVA